jgi:hypothetical protein
MRQIIGIRRGARLCDAQVRPQESGNASEAIEGDEPDRARKAAGKFVVKPAGRLISKLNENPGERNHQGQRR